MCKCSKQVALWDLRRMVYLVSSPKLYVKLGNHGGSSWGFLYPLCNFVNANCRYAETCFWSPIGQYLVLTAITLSSFVSKSHPLQSPANRESTVEWIWPCRPDCSVRHCAATLARTISISCPGWKSHSFWSSLACNVTPEFLKYYI